MVAIVVQKQDMMLQLLKPLGLSKADKTKHTLFKTVPMVYQNLRKADCKVETRFSSG